jgi:hypothetical protein
MFAKDTSRIVEIVLLLIEHGVSQEGLEKEELEYIERLKQREKRPFIPQRK